ncbi:EYxxD motif small membrane protein [Metabacillus kandeliae]
MTDYLVHMTFLMAALIGGIVALVYLVIRGRRS